jgi:hypothetical protein
MIQRSVAGKKNGGWPRCPLWVIFDRVQRCLSVGPFRFAPRADIPPDGDSDLVTHHPAREHGANREAIGELHFIGTTHHCGDGVWEAAARLY